MEIQKLMIKCCRWCGKTKIILLIRVSVILFFHECLRLLLLGLYTISSLCVDNHSAIVAYICYISLLRCNYYHEYLVCEEDNFSERYILLKGDWELLSGECLIILLKIAQLQLNSTWETKPFLKYGSSCFRKWIDQ